MFNHLETALKYNGYFKSEIRTRSPVSNISQLIKHSYLANLDLLIELADNSVGEFQNEILDYENQKIV